MPRIKELNLDVMTVVMSAGLEKEGQPPRCLTSREIAGQLKIEDFGINPLTLFGVIDNLVRLRRLKLAIGGRGSENPKTVYYDPEMEEMLVAAGVLSQESRVLEIRLDPATEGIATRWLTEVELEKQRLAAARAAAAAARTNRPGKTVGRSKR